jgi:hypothetical protein
MSAKDIYHDTIKKAIEKDNWVITDDQLQLTEKCWVIANEKSWLL